MHVRPVLVPLQRLPFRDFTAEEFMGGGVFNRRGPGGWVSMFKGSTLTLGKMSDAILYVGGAPTLIRKRSQLDSGSLRVDPTAFTDRLVKSRHRKVVLPTAAGPVGHYH